MATAYYQPGAQRFAMPGGVQNTAGLPTDRLLGGMPRTLGVPGQNPVHKNSGETDPTQPIQTSFMATATPYTMGGQEFAAQSPVPTTQSLPPQNATTQPVAGQPTPAYGLSGSEAALQNSMGGVLKMLNLGNVEGVDQITGANQQLMQLIAQSRSVGAGNTAQAMNILGATGAQNQQEFERAMQFLDQSRRGSSAAIGQGMGALSGAKTEGMDALTKAFSEAQGYFSPFQYGGAQAQQQQAALSGAMGAEAQKAAMAATMNSPEFDFMREQGLREVKANASRTGGLGGGEIMRDLERFGQGLASQRFDTAYDRLSGIAERGVNVASQQAGLAGQKGMSQSDLLRSIASDQASLAGQQAQAEAQFGSAGLNAFMNQGQMRNALAGMGVDVLGRQGQQDLTLTGQVADSIGRSGLAAADLLSSNYRTGAQIMGGFGQQMAGDRFSAGNQIAGNYGNMASQMANLQNMLGQQTGQQIGDYRNQLAQMLAGLGADESNQSMNMAQMIANLTSGAGGNLSEMQQSIGAALAGGQAGASQQMGDTLKTVASLAAMYFMSDRRLKDNVNKIGTIGKANVYSWTWRKVSGLVGEGFGFMSDEIRKIIPQAVIMGHDGYDRVNYVEVLNATI